MSMLARRPKVAGGTVPELSHANRLRANYDEFGINALTEPHSGWGGSHSHADEQNVDTSRRRDSHRNYGRNGMLDNAPGPIPSRRWQQTLPSLDFDADGVFRQGPGRKTTDVK